MRYLSSLFLFFLLVSCRSLDVAHSDVYNSSLITHTSHHDTVVLHDTVFRHDSVIYRERTIHDTVYITKEVYRDALNSKFKIQNSIIHDTIIHTDSIVEVIEYPPRAYIPPFYKRCTAIFWTLMALLLLYAIIRIRYSIK